MVQALEASLKRLKTDYIDLYWLHIWDQITPVEEVMRAFDDLVRQGNILYAGVSDMPAWVVAKANTLAELRGWTPFVGLQIEYSLIERTPERELLPMAADLRLGVTAWSPLAGGLLTGKQFEVGRDQRFSAEQPDDARVYGVDCPQGGDCPRGRGRSPRERPFGGPGCVGMATESARSGDPDHRCAETCAGQGQHRIDRHNP